MVKKKILFSKLLSSCTVLVLSIGMLGCGKQEKGVPMELYGSNGVLEEVADCQAVYLTTDIEDGFKMEDFRRYRGIDMYTTATPLTNLLEIEAVLDGLDKNALQNVFLHIEPLSLKEQEFPLEEQLQQVGKLMQEHPEITFEVLLDYPYIYSYGQELEEYCRRVEAIGEQVNARVNGILYYPGAEEWLVCNEGNYIADNRLNEKMALKLLLYNFCDGVYRVDQNGLKEKLSQLKLCVEKYQTQDIRREENTEQYYIFLGDSIFAYEPNSTCLPETFLSLANVPGANCSEGGVAAASWNTDILCLQEILGSVFAQLQEEEITLDTRFQNTETLKEGLAKLHQDKVEDRLRNRTACFVLQFGFNDYFCGVPVGELGTYDSHTFLGALESAVRDLLEFADSTEVFCDVEIILMVPGYCYKFEQGTLAQGERGGILEEYRNAVEQVARAYELKCVPLLELKEINAQNSQLYLTDEIHPGPQARFEMAAKFAEMVEEAGFTQ